LVQESAAHGRPQAGARATILGYAIPVPLPYLDHARALYTGRFPDSADYFSAHDFSLYTIKATQIRYIGGFGDIHWLAGDALLDERREPGIDPLALHIAGICKHMNEGHADSLVLVSQRLAGVPAQSARMIHVDSNGFGFIAIHGGVHKYVRLPFAAPVSSSEDTRLAMVDLVRQARALTRVVEE